MLGAVVVLLLVADGAYATFRVGSGLVSAREHFEAGAAALGDEDLVTARLEFEAARDLTVSAASMRTHPGYALGMNLPFIGGDVRVMDTLARGGELVAGAALDVLEASENADAPGGLASAFYRDGGFRLDAIRSAEPFIGDATEAVAEADELVRAAPQPRLGILAEALLSARDRIGAVSETLTSTRALMTSLPSLLGEDETRTYLLMFQTPSEARGTGGLFGMYGVLKARGGRIEIRNVGPFRKLMLPYPAKAVDAPDWFTRRYERFEALLNSQQANLSPHFPTVAQVMLNLAEAISDRHFDGVLAMDPIALEQMLGSTGPIEVKGSPVTLTSENAAEVLLYDAYVDFENQEGQEHFLRNVVETFWDRFADGELDPKSVIAAVAAKHIKWYSVEDDEQRSLVLARVGDDFTRAGDNVQFVFHNNRAINKVDYFLHREIETEIELTEAGEATVTTTISLENDAPDGPPSLSLGPGLAGDPPGLNRMYLNAIIPKGARVIDFAVNGRTRRPQLESEIDYPVAWHEVAIEPGGRAEVLVQYYVRDAFEPGGTFEMTFYPHAAVRPDLFRVHVEGPEGMHLTPRGVAIRAGDAVVLEEALDTEIRLTVSTET